MATVRFSEQLKDDVTKRAKGIFTQQHAVAKESMPKDWGVRIYDRAFGAYVPQLNAVPAEFLTHTGELEIEIPYLHDTTVEVKVALPNKRPIPRSLSLIHI